MPCAAGVSVRPLASCPMSHRPIPRPERPMIRARSSTFLPLQNKVPEVTIYFWIIKVMATTVGETAADLLSIRLNLGLSVTSYVMSAVFIVFLILQVKAKGYQAPLYW